MPEHAIVDHAEWLAARRALLAREKAVLELREAVNAERMALPWERVATDYRFETEAGERGLADLFAGRSQLAIYHFMFAPEWEAGCHGCSYLMDHLDRALVHVENHDLSVVAVSRAPLPKLLAYRRRMGWSFPWVSSGDGPFNYDFDVSFDGRAEQSFNYEPRPEGPPEMGDLPGLSVFARDAGGAVFHTYSAYGEGTDSLLSTLMLLDLTPKGRDDGGMLGFVRRRDEYDAAANGCCH